MLAPPTNPRLAGISKARRHMDQQRNTVAMVLEQRAKEHGSREFSAAIRSALNSPAAEYPESGET